MDFGFGDDDDLFSGTRVREKKIDEVYEAKIDTPLYFLNQDPLDALNTRNGEQTIKSQIDYLYFARRYEDCLKVCQLVSESEGNTKSGNKNHLTDYSIRETMARCYMKLDKLEDALKHAKVLVDDYTPEFRYWFLYSEVLFQLNHHPEAIDAFIKTLGLNPFDLYSWNYLGNSLTQQNKLPWAAHCYQKCISIIEGHITSHQSNASTVLRTIPKINKPKDKFAVTSLSFYNTHYGQLKSHLESHKPESFPEPTNETETLLLKLLSESVDELSVEEDRDPATM